MPLLLREEKQIGVQLAPPWHMRFMKVYVQQKDGLRVGALSVVIFNVLKFITFPAYYLPSSSFYHIHPRPLRKRV